MSDRFPDPNASYDAHHKLLGISPRDQPPTAYRLLGIDAFESDRDVIDAAANKQMSYLQGCCNGEHAAAAEQLLNELSSARLQLLNPGSKTQYDNELRAAIPPTLPIPPPSQPAPIRGVSNPAPVIRSGPRQRKRVSSPLRWLMPIVVPSLLSLAIAWKFGMFDLAGVRKAMSQKDFPETLSPSNPSPGPTFDRGSDLNSQTPQLERSSGETPDSTYSVSRSQTRPVTGSNNSSTPGASMAASSAEQERLDSFAAIGRDGRQPGQINDNSLMADSYNGPRLPVPENQLEAATRSIKKRFASQILDAKSPHDRQHVATVFFKLAMNSSSAGEQYVLLQMAQQYFTATNDCTGAMRAMDSLESRFDVDLFEDRATALTKLMPTTFRPSDQVAAADRAESMIAEAIRREEYVAAIELCKASKKLAADFKNVQMARKLGSQLDKAALLKEVQPKVEAARKRLESEPGHAGASEYLGRLLCFGKSQWNEGLPRLRDAENTKLATLAAADLQGPTLANQCSEMADRWWEIALATQDDPVLIRGGQERAVYWYREAITRGLSGLSKAAARSRLDQYESNHEREIAARTAPNVDRREPKPPPGAPANAIHYDGNWYLFSDKQVRFDEAVKTALNYGGRLVVVRSQAEHDFLLKHARRPLMLGMLRRDGVWYDSLRERQYFFLWDERNGQPNDHGQDLVAGIDLYTDLWHDYPNSRMYFAIEWGPE